MTDSKAIVPVIQEDITPLADRALKLEKVVAQRKLILDIMKEVMVEGVHYGKIPGCGDKPTLLQPGAQVLGVTFQFTTLFYYEVRDLPGGHREYETTCTLTKRDGTILGQGVGVASTMESKYRYRNAGRVCPKCGKEDTIIKGKDEWGGGWLCYARKNGCGVKFKDGDKAIEGQQPGKVEHPDPADYYNTIKKMSAKRASVHAEITTTGCSDIFTQDVEDMAGLIDKASAKVESNAPPPDSDVVDAEYSEENLPPESTGGQDGPPSQPVSEGKKKALFAIVLSHVRGGKPGKASADELKLVGEYRNHKMKHIDDYGAGRLLNAMDKDGDFSDFENWKAERDGDVPV